MTGIVDCCGGVFFLHDDTLGGQEQNACCEESLQEEETVCECSSTDKDVDSSQTISSRDLNQSTKLTKCMNSGSVEVSTARETCPPG